MRLFGNLGRRSTVTFEGTGRGEFPKPVADHVFGDENADEVLPVMNEEGVTNKVRRDG